ncbi:MAG: HAMP domain-containing histidine kinase, partial [Alphaproteobacteria bacterium]|nr:HAMP domain-containing histidine kinase [Alphaproteobacteria bacterium]
MRRPLRLEWLRASSARRTSVLFLGLSLTAMLLLWMLTRALTDYVLETRAWYEVDFQAASLGGTFARNGLLGLASEVSARGEAGVDSGEMLYLLFEVGGRTLAGSFVNRPPVFETLPIGRSERTLYRLVDAPGGAALEEIPFALSVYDLGRDHRLVVARNLQLRDFLTARLNWVFSLVFFPTALVLWFASHRVSRGLFLRLDRIAETSRRVQEGARGARVPRDNSGDEFDRMSAELNRMLERNEYLLEALRARIFSLAHDLRTPLTRLQGRLEEAQTRLSSRSAGEKLDAALGEVARVRRTFDSLSAIVLAETGAAEGRGEALDYREMLSDLYDLYAPLAEGQGVRLRLEVGEGDFDGAGHRQLLFQAMVNLIENALSHGAPGGDAEHEVVLRLDCAGAEILLSVEDNGPGLPEGLVARIIGDGGEVVALSSAHGLGLALVVAVARLHNLYGFHGKGSGLEFLRSESGG